MRVGGIYVMNVMVVVRSSSSSLANLQEPRGLNAPYHIFLPFLLVLLISFHQPNILDSHVFIFLLIFSLSGDCCCGGGCFLCTVTSFLLVVGGWVVADWWSSFFITIFTLKTTHIQQKHAPYALRWLPYESKKQEGKLCRASIAFYR